MNRNILERYGQPGKFDEAPYGSICKVSDHHHESFDLYVQISKTITPIWEFIDKFSVPVSDIDIESLLSNRFKI